MRENSVRMGLIAARGLQVSACLKSGVGVYYGGRLVGDFFADLLVESRVIVEIKAVRAIVKEHEVQLVNCLTATKTDDGLVINLGPSVEIRSEYRIYQKRIGKR